MHQVLSTLIYEQASEARIVHGFYKWKETKEHWKKKEEKN